MTRETGDVSHFNRPVSLGGGHNLCLKTHIYIYVSWVQANEQHQNKVITSITDNSKNPFVETYKQGSPS